MVAVAAGDYHTLALVAEGSPVLQLLRPQRRHGVFSVLLQTDMRGRYTLEQTDSLPAPNWTELPALNGNGAVLQLADPRATNAHRFYRVRRW